MFTPLSPERQQRLRDIKLLILDVDGVLTSAQLFIGGNGEIIKAFNTLDGHGIKMLHQTGVQTAIITARNDPAGARGRWPRRRRLMGGEVRRKSVRAIARTTMRSIWGQRHLLRAEVIDDGRLRTATRISDPFAMAELGRANALIVLDEDTELVRPGEAVQCWLLDES